MSEQWEDRVTSYCNFLQMHENNPEFFNKIIMGDESWCFAYELESKCQSATWVSSWSPKAHKLLFKKSRIKTMLVTFFDFQGLIHKEFVPTGQTVNANYYKDVLDRLNKRINRVRPDLHVSEDWTTQHQFASFWPKKCYSPLSPSPYLPDLAPADYFLFPKLKLQLKGRRFEDIQTIQKNVTDILKGILETDFKHTLEGLSEHSQKCVDLNCVYIE